QFQLPTQIYGYVMRMTIVIIFPGRVPHRGWIAINSVGTLMAANFFVHRSYLPVRLRAIKLLLYYFAGFLQIIDMVERPDDPAFSKIKRSAVAIRLRRRCGFIQRIKDLRVL